MNIYDHDLSLLDFNFSEAIFESLTSQRRDDDSPPSPSSPSSSSIAGRNNAKSPKHRHDGKSPLPLGMDWSRPPSKWEGQKTVWPHDPKSGWSYCVTIPSYVILPSSRGSDPVVFYRVQIGIQSPDGITSINWLLRRFSDFLKLSKELKREFPMKTLPPTPSRRLFKVNSKERLEERRCLLEDWMEKLLSDIDLSRTATVANFLELEAAVRLFFNDAYRQNLEANPAATATLPSLASQYSYDVSLGAASPSVMSDHGNDISYEISEVGMPRHDHNGFSEAENLKFDGHERKLSTGSVGSDLSSMRVGEAAVPDLFDLNSLDSESIGVNDDSASLGFQLPRDLVIALPSEERHKLNRVLTTIQQRLSTAKTDMEDVIARFNHEVAVRQFLSTKVKDLEVEVETTRHNCKENVEQATLIEKEKITQMQWDTEEIRKKCLEAEMKLKAEQVEKSRIQTEKMSVIHEKELLLHEMDLLREKLENLHRHHEELEMKSKADVKLLVKEVKSLRSTQLELKQELARLMKEKIELERTVQKDKQRMERASAANAKLLHECEILRDRLQECSVNFLIEEEDKFIVDTSSPSDAIDLLTTSDNRIGLLLAEAQLLAQDIENATATVGGDQDTNGGDENRTDDELRKMLTDIFIDNASLRKQVNSVLRCALNTCVKSEENGEDDEEISLGKTVLSKFLER